MLVLVAAAIGYLLAGFTGVVLAAIGAVLAAMALEMARQDALWRRGLQQSAEDATAALRGMIRDVPAFFQAVVPVAGNTAPNADADALFRIMQHGQEWASQHFDAVMREAVNVLGGPDALIVVPASRRQMARRYGYIAALTVPVTVREALQELKHASGEVVDEIREQIEGLIRLRQPDVARRFADEVGNYDRGMRLPDALLGSETFEGPIRSSLGATFDANRFVEYMDRNGMYESEFPNTWNALLRGASPGALVGWQRNELNRRLRFQRWSWGAAIAVGFLVTGFTGGVVGVLAAIGAMILFRVTDPLPGMTEAERQARKRKRSGNRTD